jgi:hypothetical protein
MWCLQMNVCKFGKMIFKSAPVRLAVFIVFLSFSPWGIRTGIISPAENAGAVTLVNPSPGVKVTTKSATVYVGAVQPGDFSVTIEFTVAANVSKVTMFLEASDLYRGGDTTNTSGIGSIALDTGRPAEIIVSSGTRISGPPNNITWLGTGNPIANFPGKKTETVTYEFSSSGDVTHNVFCKIWFDQGNVISTSGQYICQVRLTAAVVP